jgi:hypothetical protein
MAVFELAFFLRWNHERTLQIAVLELERGGMAVIEWAFCLRWNHSSGLSNLKVLLMLCSWPSTRPRTLPAGCGVGTRMGGNS